MPVVYSNLVFANSRRIKGLVAAVDNDEPLRKGEAAEGGPGGGEPGLSAYEVAVANGFVGDVTAWLASLHGTDGEDGNGLPGDNAYEVAVANGFVGDVTAWLASLHGTDGEDGVGTAGRDFYDKRVQTVTDASGSVTCDWGSYDEIRLTLVGNVTLTFSNGLNGQACSLKLKQDGTGSRTVALPGSVRYSADITGFIASTGADLFDRIGFIRDTVDSKYDFVAASKGFS